MNMPLHRCGGFLTLGLAATLLVASVSAQTTGENPLRRARLSSQESSASSNPVQPASHSSPLRPTGFESARHRLAANRRSVLTPRQETVTESNIIGQELIDGGVMHDGNVVHDGDIIYEGGAYEGDIMFEGGGKGGKGADDGGLCFTIPMPRICFDNFEVFAGVQGVTGPVNRGETGSFGFQEGFNWGAPVPWFSQLGGQLGLRATQSNLSGAEFTNETRRQIFLTGGLFRRVDWGLQGGLAFDYLSDDWYANTSMTQLRGEASWVFPCLHEIGFWFTSSTGSDTQLSTFSNGTAAVTETFEATNLYAFFYRHHFDAIEGAQARLYAGWTGDSDGLVGADLNLPLSPDWALQGGFAYLVPEQATGTVGRGHAEESWNIAMNLVWYPGARSAYGNDYYRPLFNVADNGSFMVGRQ
jgi:Family of unknown function (DUF6666)